MTSDTSGTATTGDQRVKRAAHTPGPWACDADWVWTNAAGIKENVICVAPYDSRLYSCAGKNWRADARLIAAAPNMLAALQACVAAFELNADPSGPTDSEQRAIALAQAAIARATGSTLGSPVVTEPSYGGGIVP